MLSAVVLTRNEGKFLSNCLESLGFCDEIIVIDDISKDATEEISRKFKVRFFKRRLNDDFSSQRNFGLEKSTGEWGLFIDADERVPQRLQKEILLKIKDDKFSGYFVKRRDFFLAKEMKYGEFSQNKFLRLGRARQGIWKRKVHEYWDINGPTGLLKEKLIHQAHADVQSFVAKINFFSTLHAQANKEENKDSGLCKIMFFPVLKLVNNYFLLGGFRDGTHGFVGAMMMSWHSFLAWSKLWLNSQK